ncbi:MAG TPA: DUF503 domain-containing protein [Bryobacteraceae bacterium]|nr:DUF503 domain-containing protein [Bryobacteraceae bacterium]HPT27844.1 DUF503 domain-containing protein [Bryobacteraceae bacterium]
MPAIGVLTLELHIDGARSLKDKRHWVRGLKDRLRASHNVAVAEIEDMEMQNHAVVAAVTVSASKENAAKILESAERMAAAFLGSNLMSANVEWVEPGEGSSGE